MDEDKSCQCEMFWFMIICICFCPTLTSSIYACRPSVERAGISGSIMLSDVTKRRVDHRSAGEKRGDGREAAISMTKETDDDRSDAASLGEEGRK